MTSTRINAALVTANLRAVEVTPQGVRIRTIDAPLSDHQDPWESDEAFHTEMEEYLAENHEEFSHSQRKFGALHGQIAGTHPPVLYRVERDDDGTIDRVTFVHRTRDIVVTDTPHAQWGKVTEDRHDQGLLEEQAWPLWQAAINNDDKSAWSELLGLYYPQCIALARGRLRPHCAELGIETEELDGEATEVIARALSEFNPTVSSGFLPAFRTNISNHIVAHLRYGGEREGRGARFKRAAVYAAIAAITGETRDENGNHLCPHLTSPTVANIVTYVTDNDLLPSGLLLNEDDVHDALTHGNLTHTSNILVRGNDDSDGEYEVGGESPWSGHLPSPEEAVIGEDTSPLAGQLAEILSRIHPLHAQVLHAVASGEPGAVEMVVTHYCPPGEERSVAAEAAAEAAAVAQQAHAGIDSSDTPPTWTSNGEQLTLLG